MRLRQAISQREPGVAWGPLATIQRNDSQANGPRMSKAAHSCCTVHWTRVNGRMFASVHAVGEQATRFGAQVEVGVDERDDLFGGSFLAKHDVGAMVVQKHHFEGMAFAQVDFVQTIGRVGAALVGAAFVGPLIAHGDFLAQRGIAFQWAVKVGNVGFLVLGKDLAGFGHPPKGARRGQ